MRAAVRTLFLLGIAALCATFLRAQSFDLVIVNGRVVDPESGLDAIRNVGISGGPNHHGDARPDLRRAHDRRDRTRRRARLHRPARPRADAQETYGYQARDGVTTSFELELGTGDVDRWYTERAAGRLINYGVSIGHIRVRSAVFNDPGSPFPTGPGAHQRASPAADSGDRAPHRAWPRAGGRCDGRGLSVHARCDAGKSS